MTCYKCLNEASSVVRTDDSKSSAIYLMCTWCMTETGRNGDTISLAPTDVDDREPNANKVVRG